MSRNSLLKQSEEEEQNFTQFSGLLLILDIHEYSLILEHLENESNTFLKFYKSLPHVCLYIFECKQSFLLRINSDRRIQLGFSTERLL